MREREESEEEEEDEEEEEEEEEEGVVEEEEGEISGLTLSDPPPNTGSVALASPTRPGLTPNCCWRMRTSLSEWCKHSTRNENIIHNWYPPSNIEIIIHSLMLTIFRKT